MDDDPLSSPYTSLDSYCPDLTVLHDHACRGAWISLLHKIPHHATSSSSKPHHHLVYLTYHLLSLFKLRRFNDANTLLVNALQQNDAVDLDSPHFRYESFPDHYPSHAPGSMIPFALRWLHALLPSTLGNSKLTLDRFYSLLHFVRAKKQKLISDDNKDGHDNGGSSNAGEKSLDLWKKRESHVISTIVGLHLNAKEFRVCSELLNEVVKEKGDDNLDPYTLSKLGYVKLMYGDLSGAKSCFDSVEKTSMKIEGNSNENTDVGLRNLIGRNKALVYLVGKDYASAVREYDNCVERDAKDVVALNNKALCLMYMRDLSDAIKVLEGALERVPTVALDETVVVNLCSMYELAYVNHGDVKKTLSNWIARVAPDDFDSSCTRI